ncbi:major capsid protein [Escherichia coli]|uniref:major capsid protein n=1 Tax=Escherichia coli TaxID=562 RepID=UPI002FCD1C70
MLDKITGKTPVAAYVSPVVEGKVLRHRGGETRVLRPGYVKPKHEFNYQQAVERLPGEDPAQLNDPAYRRLRIITDNLKQEGARHCPGGRNAGGECRAVWQIHHGRRPVREN